MDKKTPLRSVLKGYLSKVLDIITKIIKFDEKSLEFYHKLLIEHIEQEDDYFKGVSTLLQKLKEINESLYKELLLFNNTDTLLTRALRAENPNIQLIRFLILEGSDLYAIDLYGNAAYEYIKYRKIKL